MHTSCCVSGKAHSIDELRFSLDKNERREPVPVARPTLGGLRIAHRSRTSNAEPTPICITAFPSIPCIDRNQVHTHPWTSTVASSWLRLKSYEFSKRQAQSVSKRLSYMIPAFPLIQQMWKSAWSIANVCIFFGKTNQFEIFLRIGCHFVSFSCMYVIMALLSSQLAMLTHLSCRICNPA